MKAGFIGVLLAWLVIAAAAITEAQSIPGLEEKQEGGIGYVSGGIGQDERNALAAMTESYNAKLVFSLVSGKYLSGIGVKIADRNGKSVLDMKTDGPWLLAKLPAGKYTVTAEYEGAEQKKSLTVVNSLQIVSFYWQPTRGEELE